ncbi:MAG: GDP-mannose 4,6-dehydratase [Planctomycetaceae bacterium]|nr:SDR family NAD(P)-dependent oxidoreductase [Planctomycetaceae bacterium]
MQDLSTLTNAALQSNRLGVVEWFRVGERQRVGQALADLKALGVHHIRTGISWADWMLPEGPDWFDFLIPALGKDCSLMPCFVFTPPSCGRKADITSPPRRPKAYADFIDVMITRYGRYFEYVELWNEPNSTAYWDMTQDPDATLLGQTIGSAAYWARRRGKKTVLGGMSPIDANWLEMIFDRGVMEHIDVVGVHGFPASFDYVWHGWQDGIDSVQRVLDKHKNKAQIWITETGFPAWRHEHREQLRQFFLALAAPAQRVYWYSLHDLHPEAATPQGFHMDDREYFFGLKDPYGEPKLLYRLLANQGLSGLRRHTWLTERASFNGGRRKNRPVLITGGAGFIGTNLADALLRQGNRVLLVDNLSRHGVEGNLTWLRRRHGQDVQVELADVRDAYAMQRLVRQCRAVYHLAAQVAVTSSLDQPRQDMDVNVVGTMNILEAIRSCDNPPPLLYTSTNKVYGSLEDMALVAAGTRYAPLNPQRRRGVSEDQPLNFYSPYGCSKGAADQYVLDYARSFGLATVVFRMSCIYGPHQMGNEDQGWLAHFLLTTLNNRRLHIYGDGKQVRDVLYVDDLVAAMLAAQGDIDRLSGRAFNIGGGATNTVSLLEVIEMIGRLHGQAPQLDYHYWRLGDQRLYVSDISSFTAATGWQPTVGVERGLTKLYRWLAAAQRARRRAARIESVAVASERAS